MLWLVIEGAKPRMTPVTAPLPAADERLRPTNKAGP